MHGTHEVLHLLTDDVYAELLVELECSHEIELITKRLNRRVDRLALSILPLRAVVRNLSVG